MNPSKNLGSPKLIRPKAPLPTIGWREWVSLPALNIPAIKAKVDTGARTSALHAFSLTPFTEDGKAKIKFAIHPLQKNTDYVMVCVADIIDKRWVVDSGGHAEERYVIETALMLGDRTWPIEVTLTDRETMVFRMLLGRSAIRKNYIINPAKSFLTKQSTIGSP